MSSLRLLASLDTFASRQRPAGIKVAICGFQWRNLGRNNNDTAASAAIIWPAAGTNSDKGAPIALEAERATRSMPEFWGLN